MLLFAPYGVFDFSFFLLSNAQVFLKLGATDYRVWPLQSSFDKTCK